MEKIVLLHTNDLHSHLENWPKIRRFIEQKKRENEKKENTTTITVDLGDFVDRWHPLSEATDGQANVELMNNVGYDAVTIGNNEGVGNAKDQLNHLYDQANFDILLDNLFDKHLLQPPKWAKKYKIIETPQQTKIGLLALTTPFPLTYSPNGWDIRNPYDILPELVEELRPKVDILVLMSHLGIQDDRQIAQELPSIDVILGSHTHHLLIDGQIVNGVQLAAAGKYGQYVGEVHLTVDEHKNIIQKSARAIPTETMMTFIEDEQESQDYLTKGHELLAAKKVAKLPYDLSVDIFAEHSFIYEALEAVKYRGQTQGAMLNSGLFLTGLPAGLINQDQLHTALPHPMHLLNVTLKGSDLIRLVLEIEKNRAFLRNYPIRGMGFRGKIFGQVVYSGISYDAVNHQVHWLNQPIDNERRYTFTTVDHFMFVPFFPTIEIAGENEFLFPEFIRSVVGEYLNAHYPIK
ncbi:bifunctional metallophosphatase/5'-nucleotidase [Enterococcus hirae]|uniref:bifunctional metallophosphatase/5'-nucleotidase n=1 Tax=Enterococcus hirae TaxID=1354 RepID=UPI0009C02931|nr:bifunctional metallophosphatase/5'-nucleotidase [Enterococcus hirae]EMF0076050.1 metallophosphoesterase [Enterococcus hirae]MBA5266873.1 metallophosphoesterase [Enterococcus hirae]OQO46036.1 multifunctional 2',3'-cyclic-nucleotide 2'-phosphodiesterase/5'-nucleotidase/3'-nucleotidase [Enterococcus hirae]OQO53515.1 multifunctional 2',3'-cyclic-nucleotide 2'-phosphodiesterase/5'-nucleotidase/3'-nucleotidase [Enterococcus hirae]QKX66843.1 metallophosphoesterase [Enterococcus hirae]